MKLLGTHVYPKNKYLTLQMTRSAKGVACEDVFESMIVFSEAWWVGTKEENHDELKLEFPKEMQNVCMLREDVDFKGGAGAASGEVVTVNKPRKQAAVPRTAEPRTPEPHTLEYESDADSEDSDVKDEIGTQTTSDTPVRKSARTAGKTFKFAELAGGDSAESDTEIEFAEDLDEKVLLLRSSEQLQRKNSHQRRRKASMATLGGKASGSQKKQKAKVDEDEIEELSDDPSQDDDAGPAAKKQRGTPKGKQSAAKKEASGSWKKKKAKVDEELSDESYQWHYRMPTWVRRRTMIAMTTGLGKGSDKEYPDLTCRENGGSGMSDPPSLPPWRV
ncbi:hypothetical protein TRIUR3_15405 [Triticum urartu]|uniref:DNA-binding protein RHL1 n=1 Tax=Triticum urartu TaxID=4572 RepID=M7ZCV0_TRIUA|nr:hypothetical protein TRIUR3_15405 [Triticum urartu]